MGSQVLVAHTYTLSYLGGRKTEIRTVAQDQPRQV
jgi:hypothetical protein